MINIWDVTYGLSQSKTLDLMPWSTMPLARSTCPLLCGCATEAYQIFMLSSSHQSLNSDPVNCVPLSVMILLGTPNLTTMSWKNSLALAAVIVATGLASIHLVNLSMATKRCV